MSDTDLLTTRITGKGANEIADVIASLIRAGDLTAATQLPTIRMLAAGAGVSVGTIAEAWSLLRAAGLIDTRRRGGTVVVAPPLVAREFSWADIDLVTGQADVSLQPPLGDALVASLVDADLHIPRRDHVTPQLARVLESTWPFSADEFSTAGGGTEALLLAIEAAAPPGSTVAIQEPLMPGILDTLDDLGIAAVGIAGDTEGPTVASLTEALADPRVVAVVLQPSAPFGRRGRLTDARAVDLADALRDSGVWIIEDDSLGPLASVAAPTLGSAHPSRVLRIRSYCKAYGIDLRTSALGGSRELVERARRLRSHGVAVNSRILQNALAHLIESPESAVIVASAREIYAKRRDALLDALRAAGVAADAAPDGLVVWATVRDETRALLMLAAHGILVGEGRRAVAGEPEAPAIRIATTQLPDDPARVRELAEHIAVAALGQRDYFD